MPADSAYGVVHISVCNLRDEGKFTSGMSTQALLGMPVKVLQYTGWYEIQTPDDYTGWVHRMVITPMSKERYNEWNRAEKIVVTAHYGFTYEKPDEKSQTVSDVVAGNRLKWEGSKGHFYKVSYPDGRQAYISKSISQPETKWRASLKQDVESIIETAYTMIGIPYLWAGTSSKGVDCSGLVRTVLFMHDIIIPRDASQQAYVGERIEITSDFANVQRGDLVFFGRKAFSGRKEGISHVGIYLGNKQFIHALGDVHISSFEPADKNYDEFNTGRLLFAVRFLPYINNWATCDILSVKAVKGHLDSYIKNIYQWLESDYTYTIRFGINMLMRYYLEEEFKIEYPEKVAAIRSEEYYVNMVRAWYFATALAKKYDQVLPFLEEQKMDVWTHNKTIQKAIESYRITLEQKEYLRTLKIK